MKSNEILENLPISIYIAKYKITNNEFKVIDFQIIKNAGFSGFSDEELTPETVLSGFDKDEIKNFINFAKTLSKNQTFSIKYHFKVKNGKILYFKDYLRLIEVKNNIYTFLGVITDISKEFQFSEIFHSVYNSPFIGLLIYKEKIILVDESLKKMFEIGDEIYNIDPLDLISDKYKNIARKNLQRRLKGEKFSYFYTLELKTFKNRRFYAELFADTIFYENGYAGLIFFIDKTKMYKHNIFLKLSVEIDDSIVNEDNESKLLKNIEEKFKKIDYFSEVKMNEKFDKEIKIDNDLKSEKYNSFFYLPIVINDKVIASYSFYSVYKDDFSDEIVSTLKDIQSKIALSVKNIKFQKTLTILKNAIDKSYQWFLIVDENKKIIYINDAVEDISRYKKEELIGKSPNVFKSGFHSDGFYEELWETITNGEIFNDILINRDKNGHLFYLKDKIVPVKIDNEIYFVSLGIDVTKEKLLEEKISSIKHIDNLTQLYNRNGLLFYGENKLKENKKVALFIIDIEDFKLLNETKGYKYGDLILQEFAHILEVIFVGEAIIARLGNDDFAVLIEYDNIKALFPVINKIFEKIEQKLSININIGISTYPKDAKNIKDLIEKAYIALSFKQKSKENGFSFYDINISSEIKTYMQAKDFVNEALEKKEFVYYFQPYVNTKTLKFYGAESLLRIKTKDKIITPYFFIDYAEKSGMIKHIEILMMQELVKTIKKLKFPLSFNLSGISFKDEKHMHDLIKISKDYSEFITIEITERELIENLKLTEKFFALFKDIGYKIAIDDFGTGYSSLSYISNIPIDILKIDISFIRNLTNSKKDLIVVETIIDFAKKLNLKTIAEGVETKEQIEILKNLECDYLQGYYFSKPVPFDEFKKLIRL